MYYYASRLYKGSHPIDYIDMSLCLATEKAVSKQCRLSLPFQSLLLLDVISKLLTCK